MPTTAASAKMTPSQKPERRRGRRAIATCAVDPASARLGRRMGGGLAASCRGDDSSVGAVPAPLSTSSSSNDVPAVSSVSILSLTTPLVSTRRLPIVGASSRRASCSSHSFSSVCPAEWNSVRSTRSTSASISSAVW